MSTKWKKLISTISLKINSKYLYGTIKKYLTLSATATPYVTGHDQSHSSWANLPLTGHFTKGWSLKFPNFTSDSSLYLWKKQEFQKIEEVWPTLFFIIRGGHTSLTLLNSCSFQRYRLSYRNLYGILLLQTLWIGRFTNFQYKLCTFYYLKLV